MGPLPHPDGRACVNGACGCALKTDCDFGVSCLNYSCADVGPSIGAGWYTDIGDRIDVYYTAQIGFGAQHWDWIRVFNATTGAYIGFMSAYHVDAGFGTYFGGSGQWPASWYRFHGSKEQFRQRGLPRLVKFRFIDAANSAYSGYSDVVDLGDLP